MDVLLAKAIGMFPEGVGAPKAFAKVGTTAAKLTNGLLEIAKDATDAFFKQRGYKPTTPAATKAKLGYALDKYETAAYLVTGAMHLPLISKFEAWFIGKRINNIIGASGTIGSQLKPLRKRGKAALPQVAALLRAPAALNFDDPPPRPAAAAPPAAAPAPSPPPPPPPMPLPPPMPPPSTPLPPAAESSPQVDYIDAGDCGECFFATARHPEIPGYRGRPGIDEAERFWNPQKPPCVPSDHRPAHLHRHSSLAAKAATCAARVEETAPGSDDEYEEEYEVALVRYKHAFRRLRESFPEVDEEHGRRPCPCGHGALPMWPWVVQTAGLGYCECDMATWERICWRSEWERAARAELGWRY